MSVQKFQSTVSFFTVSTGKTRRESYILTDVFTDIRQSGFFLIIPDRSILYHLFNLQYRHIYYISVFKIYSSKLSSMRAPRMCMPR